MNALHKSWRVSPLMDMKVKNEKWHFKNIIKKHFFWNHFICQINDTNNDKLIPLINRASVGICLLTAYSIPY